MNDYACFYIFEKTKITSISRKIICCMVPANANILYMLFPVKRSSLLHFRLCLRVFLFNYYCYYYFSFGERGRGLLFFFFTSHFGWERFFLICQETRLRYFCYDTSWLYEPKSCVQKSEENIFRH